MATVFSCMHTQCVGLTSCGYSTIIQYIVYINKWSLYTLSDDRASLKEETEKCDDGHRHGLFHKP